MGTTTSRTSVEEEGDLSFTSTSNIREIIPGGLPLGYEFYDIIEEIIGLESTTGSPTDQWIVRTKPDVLYNAETRAVINLLFLKITLTEATVRKFCRIPEVLEFVSGLRYEARVYDYIQKNILETGTCPYFLPYYKTIVEVGFFDLLKILEGDLTWKSVDKKYNLQRSVNYMLNNRRGRPSINRKANDTTWKFVDDNKWKDVRFNILVTKSMITSTLSKYFEKKLFEVNTMWKILLQIAIGCYSMFLNGITHNDLHLNNIFLDEYEEEHSFVHYLNRERPLIIRSRYHPRIFDYDRSYCKRLGKNAMLEEEFYKGYHQCNRVSNNFDIVKVMCYVINKDVPDMFKRELIECVLKREYVREASTQLSNCQFSNLKEEEMNVKFNDIETIIERLSMKVRDVYVLPEEASVKIKVYVMYKDMYESNGKIKNLLELRQEIAKRSRELKIIDVPKSVEEKKLESKIRRGEEEFVDIMDIETPEFRDVKRVRKDSGISKMLLRSVNKRRKPKRSSKLRVKKSLHKE